MSQKWIATKQLSVPNTLMALNVMVSTDNGLRNAWADFVFIGNYWKGPNIHTWFLSITEQFYFIFPFFADLFCSSGIFLQGNVSFGFCI
ncbi:hypothetical protein LEP1GSC124_3151 [Leptospira interrogans serovar Pyrogenes str. 200701872]|uniref:Uncharacterized protein n=1 Tax=Leptospira interrogans serovar Pyrogenes str. 200701872 TaxID=1193029 RepID=M6ZL59_LEPIR|nr:hypothetical protein LEP1GSC124_3151 [Leptospira interrogans serovar Pyrogenes str. 200701872]